MPNEIVQACDDTIEPMKQLLVGGNSYDGNHSRKES